MGLFAIWTVLCGVYLLSVQYFLAKFVIIINPAFVFTGGVKIS